MCRPYNKDCDISLKGRFSWFSACAYYDASKITSIVCRPITSDMSICKLSAKFAHVMELSCQGLTQSILFTISKFMPSQCAGNVISVWQIIQLPALWYVLKERWEHTRLCCTGYCFMAVLLRVNVYCLMPEPEFLCFLLL